MSNIFVFGSNLRGVHGAGAALYAFRHYGAKLGVGVGMSGHSYAIPTKDENIRTLPLETIEKYVKDFLYFASKNPDLIFMITPIGTGLAGYSISNIAPMFLNVPSNCYFIDENGNNWVKSYFSLLP